MSRRAVIVHGLDDCRAALAAAARLGVPVTLRSAPGAAANLGAPVFRAMVARARAEFPDADGRAVLDCASDPGFALAAIREGVDAVRLEESAEARARVADIAARAGVEMDADPATALDLANEEKTLSACEKWLAMKEK